MKDYCLLPAFHLSACTVAPLGNLYPLCDRSRRQPFGRFSKKMSLCGSGERENRSWAEKMKAEARAKQKVAHILEHIFTNNVAEIFPRTTLQTLHVNVIRGQSIFENIKHL